MSFDFFSLNIISINTLIKTCRTLEFLNSHFKSAKNKKIYELSVQFIFLYNRKI